MRIPHHVFYANSNKKDKLIHYFCFRFKTGFSVLNALLLLDNHIARYVGTAKVKRRVNCCLVSNVSMSLFKVSSSSTLMGMVGVCGMLSDWST